ncbi:MAG: hypothetical protein J7M26_02335, partial [Armatimonadetes bacterium]|nr:hypothetical protein [Armatimonadota bacterium]
KQKAYFAPGGKQRFEVIWPKGRAGDLAVVDGKQQWHYSPRSKEVRVLPVPPGGGLGGLPPMAASPGPPPGRGPAHGPRRGGGGRWHMEWKVLGEARVAGRKCWVLGMKTRMGSTPVKLYIDEQKFVLLAAYHRGMRGGRVEQWYFENVKFTDRLDPRLFVFKPPSGVKVIQGPRAPQRMPLEKAEEIAGMKALVPRYVPPGFVFLRDKVAVIQRGGRAALWLMFQGPGKSFSIFQSRRLPPGGKPAQAVARWDAGPYTLLVVGDISSAEAEKVRRSLPPAPRQ